MIIACHGHSTAPAELGAFKASIMSHRGEHGRRRADISDEEIRRYSLFEKLCELGVPAPVHATGAQSERTPHTLHFAYEELIAVFGLVNSDVFKDFPNLKIVVSRGWRRHLVSNWPLPIGRFAQGN